MPKTKMLPILLAPLLLAACGPGPLAEAGAHRLSVDDAAGLIAEHSSVLADTQVVRVFAELWVDYTLLASRLGTDTTLASLNVDPVTEPPRLEMTLALLRDEVLRVDTAVSDEELTERFAAELPGARATAAQILLAFPRAPPPGSGTASSPSRARSGSSWAAATSQAWRSASARIRVAAAGAEASEPSNAARCSPRSTRRSSRSGPGS